MPSNRPSNAKAKPHKSGHAWCLQGLANGTQHEARIPFRDIAAAAEAIIELDAANLSVSQAERVDRALRLAMCAADLCSLRVSYQANDHAFRQFLKVNGARPKKKKQNARELYGKINIYIADRLRKRGMSKQPSLTQIRGDAEVEFDVSKSTVLRAQESENGSKLPI